MEILESIVDFLNKNDESGATKEQIFESLEGRFSQDEFEWAMGLLLEKLFSVGTLQSIKEKDGIYQLSRKGKQYLVGFLQENKKKKYKNIKELLCSRKGALEEKNATLNSDTQNDEITKLILGLLQTNTTLELNEIISEIANIKNKKHGDGYLLGVRSVLNKIRIQGLISRYGKQFQITEIGLQVLAGKALAAEIFEPKNTNELKRFVEQGIDLSKVSIAFLENLDGVFENYTGSLSGIENWEVTHITSMNRTFKNVDLNGINLSAWDVSGVQSLNESFKGARNISGIEQWQTKSLESMDSAFENCENFNLNLSEWRTELLKSLKYAFKNAKDFEGYMLNDWHLDSFNALGAFDGAKSEAEWAYHKNVEHEFYIYEFNKDIPSDFKFCPNENSLELKKHLNSGVSWLRSEVRNNIKFYFKDLEQQNVSGRILWNKAIIEAFDKRYYITMTKISKKEAFVIYLNKLSGEEFENNDNEEEYVNPLIRLIKKGDYYSTGQNNDDIYFGYKGIFVDSKRFSLAMRTMILYIIARAYKEKLEGFIEVSAKKGANLDKINEEASKFNLEKYFSMPIITSDGALQAGIWAKIFDLYELDSTQAQIATKISTMASILADRRSKTQQYIIAAATAIITAFVGIIPLFNR